MAELTHPEISVIMRPVNAIPYRNKPGFLVCDLLGDLVNLGMGDSQGLAMQGQNPTISDSWLQSGADAGQWKIPNNIGFVRFLKDGVFREGASAQSSDPNSDLFGVIITGRIAYLDSKIGDTTLSAGFTPFNWEEVQGDWQSVSPPGAQRYLRIRSAGSGPTHKARSVGDVPANRQLTGEARFWAQGGATGQAASRFQWGGDGDGALSICWRHGQKITVERKEGGVWRVLRALDMEPANMAGGRYSFHVRRLAGRLCININDRAFHFVFIDTPISGRAKPIDAYWPEGKLQINTFNCHGTFGVGIIKYADSQDNVYTGEFGRILRKNVPVSVEEQMEPPELKFNGWMRGGTWIEGNATVSDFGVDYNVTLTASFEGIDTPFCSKVLCRFAPEWKPRSVSGVQLRPAIQSMRITLPSLPSTPYAEASITLDREQLDRLVPDWEQYVDKYRPVEITARRKYEDGTYHDSEPAKLFKGYSFKIDYASNGPGSRFVTLVFRDNTVRLQKPAAVIDHRYPPLDVVFGYMGNLNPTTPVLWGYDAVREILRTAIGDTDADALQAFFVNHYPLLDLTNDAAGFIFVQAAILNQPPTKGGLLFPAPYGDSALDWILKVAGFDKAVFYYGWPEGLHNEWAVPMYGRIPQIIATMPTITIPDNDYLSGDTAKLLLSVTTESRPDRDFNRVLAWANPNNESASDFMPATRMGVDQLQMPDINAPERSWERTMVIREDFGWIPGGVEALASGVTMLLGDSEMTWPSFTTRGNPSLQWGVKATFKMSGSGSDETIKLDGKTFRCERVEHNFDMALSGPDLWTTNVNARPTSRGIF